MAEWVDAKDLKSFGHSLVRVRVPLPVHKNSSFFILKEWWQKKVWYSKVYQSYNYVNLHNKSTFYLISNIMNIGLVIVLCIAFYTLTVFLTLVRIEDETVLNRTNKVFRFCEALLYSLTTVLLLLGVYIWLH